ncbi:hypothetical protein [Alteribacillus bidgolensis]|uniref:Uncharacterized protein n=1 Tax=Alteribacillus bidgolensis TaxID=930129 RepID=A0A1G8I923_9BACI|nr:hypothetical protein SAMN05216352_10591 [Alteribacillus bidgolensis]
MNSFSRSPYHMDQNPYHMNQNPHHMDQNPYHNPHQLKHMVLNTVEPVVQYGLKEAQYTSYKHALREVAAITYLMGMGYNPMAARQMVESWEVNETFYPR